MNISKEKLETIVKLFPYPVYIWKNIEKELILLDYNKAAEDITNRKVRDILGIKASIFHKNQPEILRDLNHCINEKVKIFREMNYTFKTTGLEKILYVTYQPILSDLIMVITEDITEKKKAEQELKESEEVFRIMLEKSGIAIAALDLKGNFIMVNDITLKRSGYTREEFLQLNAADVALEVIPMEHKKRYWEKLAFGEHTKVIGMHKRKDGSTFPAETTLVKIKLQNQPIIAVFVRELTEYKEMLQESEISKELYQLISKNINDLISINDHEGRFLYCNEAYKKVLGYAPEELIGTVAFKYVHPEDINKVLHDFEKVKQKEFLKNEVRFKCRDGSYKWLEYNGRGIHDENNTFIKTIGISREITLRKEAEQKLKKSEKKYREAFNQAELYKDLFAHDINNILQVIMNSNDLSMIYLKDKENRKNIKKMLKIIDEQVKRGVNLISNIQILSKLDKKIKDLHPTEVLAVLKKIRKLILNSFPDKEISIKIRNPFGKIFVQADNLLREVFENILNNAIQHNVNPNIEIIIKISREHKKSINYYKIEFIDNGRGIPNDMKVKIFKRDYRKKYRGKRMGLGLSLVKKILEIYNGDIWVENNVKGDSSKGSNFIILIPESS